MKSSNLNIKLTITTYFDYNEKMSFGTIQSQKREYAYPNIYFYNESSMITGSSTMTTSSTVIISEYSNMQITFDTTVFANGTFVIYD